MKPFNQVQIGDLGTEYGNFEVKVVDKGTAKQLYKKYPQNGSNLSELRELGYSLDTEAVAVRFTKPDWSEAGPIVYVYGGDGVTVDN